MVGRNVMKWSVWRVYSASCGVDGFLVAELKILISKEQIAQRVAEMGAQITSDFSAEPIILVGVLKGAAMFVSDLARHIQLDVSLDFIGVSSYGNLPSPSRRGPPHQGC